MACTLLLLLLVLALMLKLALTSGAFFAPAFTFAKFGVTYGPNMAFLDYIVAWTLLFVSLVDVGGAGAGVAAALPHAVLPAGAVVGRRLRGLQQARQPAIGFAEGLLIIVFTRQSRWAK